MNANMFKGPPKKARADSSGTSPSTGDDVPSGAQDLLALVMGGGGGGDDDDNNNTP